MRSDERSYPSELLREVVSALCGLPGVGEHTALQHALYLLSRPESETVRLASALESFRRGVHLCKHCHSLSDGELCDVCLSPLRDRSLCLVVENVGTVMTIERTGSYRGVYHVLGGLISPMNGVGPGELRIESLLERVGSGEIKEVCFALSPTMEGDTTAYYLEKRLRPLGVRITMISRGVAPGDALQYADAMTLARSIEERKEFSV